jgi:hypothetical protein
VINKGIEFGKNPAFFNGVFCWINPRQSVLRKRLLLLLLPVVPLLCFVEKGIQGGR